MSSRLSVEIAARLLLLLHDALRIEVADPPTLGSGGGIDDRVDECRLARVHGLVDRP